jgi:transcriptional regulator with XRE-family HTH domain
MSRIGELVRQARKRKSMTQTELADRTGLAPGSIGMLESGKVDRPYPDTLKKLSQALDLSMSELVAATGQLDAPGVDDYTQERVEAEAHRIAAIPGTQAKMDALMRLSPALFELVEALVHEVLSESVRRPTQAPPPRRENGTHDLA